MSQWGLSEAEYNALMKVSALLRSGTVYHFKTPDKLSFDEYERMYSVTTRGKDPIVFDMMIAGKQFPCGYVSCISGLVARELGLDPIKFFMHGVQSSAYTTLYAPRSRHTTPEMAADAIDSFLLTGKPNWREL